jgi:hypothetical protein
MAFCLSYRKMKQERAEISRSNMSSVLLPSVSFILISVIAYTPHEQVASLGFPSGVCYA